MKALISPNEDNRIVEVAKNEFPVAEPLFWVDCPDECTTRWKYYENSLHRPELPPLEIASKVSMRQARLALLKSGLLDKVNTAIQSAGEADKITWEYATEVDRDDALVVNLAYALKLTSKQLDDLFRLASTL